MRLPVLLTIICYFLLVITDLCIIYDLRNFSLYKKFRPGNKRPGNWWKVYLVFALLVLCLLTIAVSLPRRSENVGIGANMWLLYIVLTVEVAQIIYVIFSLIGVIPTLFRYPRWNTGLWIGLPLSVLFFSMMWWGVFIGRYKIQVNDVVIYSAKLPESFNGYKIAQISDLHLGSWGNDTTFVHNLVDSVNNLDPDLILFTGDIVNRTSDEMLPFLQTLSRLKATDGVFSVLGNHDYGDYVSWSSSESKKANLDSLLSYQKKAGWKLLNNASASLKNVNGDSIVLIGVENWGEPPFSQYGNLKKAYPERLFKDSNFKILMSHNPEHWNREVSKITNIDLTLSGHTHAMQIMFDFGNLKWSPSQYKYSQWGGSYSRKNEDNYLTRIYVNIGAGEVGIPMRIGASPEITLFTLKKIK